MRPPRFHVRGQKLPANDTTATLDRDSGAFAAFHGWVTAVRSRWPTLRRDGAELLL